MTTADVDVVVAGAGAAGTTAALAAAERGLSVLLIDGQRDFRRSNNTAMSTSMVPAGGSRWQRIAGVDDDPERFLADIMAKTKREADPTLARVLTQAAPDLVEWLADRWEIPLELVTDFSYPGHSRDRCHAVPDRSGRTLLKHLLDAVASVDRITHAVPIRITGIEVDDTTDAIRGAHLESPDGSQELVVTDAVVLATNGFGADPDLVRRHVPAFAEGMYHGSDASRGDALRIGSTVDADTAFLDAYQGHGSLAVPHRILLTWAVVMHGGYLVNRFGHRFGDETIGYSEFAEKVLSQPDGVAWALFDERVHAAVVSFADYRTLLEAEALRWGSGADELAPIIGCEGDELARTIEAARRTALGAEKDAFGRTSWEEPLRPPFAAVQVTGALFHTQGGLRVDGNARVLRSGEPVPGLYAAGGAAQGVSGHGSAGYLAGNGLLGALGLGLIAGRHVAIGSVAPPGDTSS